MKLYNPLSALSSYSLTSLLQSAQNFSLADIPDLSGKIAVITGGQAGVGREITAQLLLHGISKVYILARSLPKYQDSITEWVNKKGLKRSDVESRTEFVPCDLSSVKAVAEAANHLLAKLNRLDILFNNAAVPPIPEYALSPEGIETFFAINYVGHFALTLMLLPLIERTAASFGDARIVESNTPLHKACQELNLVSLTSPTRIKSPVLLDSCWRHARSKLATLMFTRELTHRLQKKGVSNVYVNSFVPGRIATTEAAEMWKLYLGDFLGTCLKSMMTIGSQTVEDGAATAMFLATSQDVEARDIKGKYFVPIAVEDTPSPMVENKDLSKNLWYWTDHKITEALGQGWQNVAEDPAS